MATPLTKAIRSAVLAAILTAIYIALIPELLLTITFKEGVKVAPFDIGDAAGTLALYAPLFFMLMFIFAFFGIFGVIAG